MLNLDQLVAEESAVSAATVKTSNVSWKELIVQHMTSQEEPFQTIESVLKATDASYDGSNYSKRKKCFESQMTYIRQDLSIHVSRAADDKVALVGVIRGDQLIPFKNAVSLLK